MPLLLRSHLLHILIANAICPLSVLLQLLACAVTCFDLRLYFFPFLYVAQASSALIILISASPMLGFQKFATRPALEFDHLFIELAFLYNIG